MNKLKIFNKTANNWLKDLEKKDEEEILINPFEGSWSFSELYDHIIRVGRSYQIPNSKKSITSQAERRKTKNIKGIAIFNLGIRMNVKIQMEKFPEPLVKSFTPVKQNKLDLIKDFKLFIKEVNDLKEILMNSSRKNKHYHPIFGDITTKDWVALIEIHISHHNRQKNKINIFLKDR